MGFPKFPGVKSQPQSPQAPKLHSKLLSSAYAIVPAHDSILSTAAGSARYLRNFFLSPNLFSTSHHSYLLPFVVLLDSSPVVSLGICALQVGRWEKNSSDFLSSFFYSLSSIHHLVLRCSARSTLSILAAAALRPPPSACLQFVSPKHSSRRDHFHDQRPTLSLLLRVLVCCHHLYFFDIWRSSAGLASHLDSELSRL